MSFPTSGTSRVGIDTAGDQSGAAYNTDGSAKVEWATMLNNAYDTNTSTFKVSVAGVKGGQIGPFQINYSGLTATKDVITAIPLGFIGQIVKQDFGPFCTEVPDRPPPRKGPAACHKWWGVQTNITL